MRRMALVAALLALPGCVVHTYHHPAPVVYHAPVYRAPPVVVYRHVPRTYYVPDYHTHRQYYRY